MFRPLVTSLTGAAGGTGRVPGRCHHRHDHHHPVGWELLSRGQVGFPIDVAHLIPFAPTALSYGALWHYEVTGGCQGGIQAGQRYHWKSPQW